MLVFQCIQVNFSFAKIVLTTFVVAETSHALFQRWVMQLAKAKCPVRRLWISSLTEESIREGFRHLRDQRKYDNLFHAGVARATGD